MVFFAPQARKNTQKYVKSNENQIKNSYILVHVTRICIYWTHLYILPGLTQDLYILVCIYCQSEIFNYG